VIPNLLHQVWVGPPMPDHLARYTVAWAQLHSDWQIHLWDEHNLPPLHNQWLYDHADEFVADLTPRHNRVGYAGQLRSDIVRYEILYSHGGVYIDVDCEPRRRLDPLLDDLCFLGWEETNVWANNAVMGSVPGHPFLAALIEHLPAHVIAHRGHRPNVLSGPRFVTAMLAQAGNGVTVHPRSYFYPYGHGELHRHAEPFPDAYCVHHWENARRKRKAPR
jgi:mannosyltransferase OCH1-like enzyme